MKMNIKTVHVEGNVEVLSGSMHVKAETIDYDPQKHIMIARGAGRKRVQKFNFKGIGKVRAGDQGVVWPKRSS